MFISQIFSTTSHIPLIPCSTLMVHVINLISSSSPSKPSSPQNIPRSSSHKRSTSSSSLSLSHSHSQVEIDNEAYEKFKLEWRKNRTIEQEEDDNASDLEDKPAILSDNLINTTPASFSILNHFKSPIRTCRRTSDSFRITPIKSKLIPEEANRPLRFKNKLEAINLVRLYMSKTMAEAYENELRRRFIERQMCSCVSDNIEDGLIPAEMASFRWKFQGRDDFLPPRLFILDSETVWDEYIASKRFKDLLQAYREPNVFLYFMNWKRAAQKHSNLLNRQFREALNASHTNMERMTPANELENEFFLTAAQMRLQVNFGSASSGPQSLVDLMDFVIEMTRVVALQGYLATTRKTEADDSEELNLTVARDVKVKSGKDPRDCWIRTLCQIPRVTPPIAETIVSAYPSFFALMEAYEGPTANPQDLLTDLVIQGGNRRIGPSISARIYNHFQ